MALLNSGKRISINILSSLFQVVGVGLAYLLIYKYLLTTLGVKQLGVWSIILATSSLANLANFGITSGLVKFVADYNAKEQQDEIPKLIFTAFVSIFVFFSVLIIILFVIGRVLLGYFIETEYLSLAVSVLPYSLFCLFVNSLGAIFSSGLEGFQKNYIRNLLIVFSTILLLGLTYLLVPKYQLKGVALAQIAQAVCVLLGSFFFLRRTLRLRIFNKWNWDKHTFKQLMNFGMKFQVMSVFLMLFEPTSKGLISKFGGLGLLGYYEMASRLTTQLRALIVNSNQVMIPVVAHTLNTKKDKLLGLYTITFNLTFFVDLFLITGLLVFTPLISILWIGHIQPMFIFSMIVLCISVFINILNGPAYFSSIGEGKLGSLLISHVLMSVLNLILGLVFGYFFGGKAVIVTSAVALIIGSVYLIYNYHKNKSIAMSFLFSKYNVKLFFVNVFLAVLLYLSVDKMLETFLIWVVVLVYAVLYGSVFLYFLLKNDIFKRFLSYRKQTVFESLKM